MNRSGNRPSHEGAAAYVDSVIVMLKSNGWRSILLRGDTDFSQTEHLDRWDRGGVQFHFGYDATPNLKKIAQELPKSAWTRLDRPSGVRLTDKRRQKPERVKEQIVIDREFKNIKLLSMAGTVASGIRSVEGSSSVRKISPAENGIPYVREHDDAGPVSDRSDRSPYLLSGSELERFSANVLASRRSTAVLARVPIIRVRSSNDRNIMTLGASPVLCLRRHISPLLCCSESSPLMPLLTQSHPGDSLVSVCRCAIFDPEKP